MCPQRALSEIFGLIEGPRSDDDDDDAHSLYRMRFRFKYRLYRHHPKDNGCPVLGLVGVHGLESS